MINSENYLKCFQILPKRVKHLQIVKPTYYFRPNIFAYRHNLYSTPTRVLLTR